MCRGQTRSDLASDAQDFSQFEGSAVIELLLQRLTVDQLHHQVRRRTILHGVNCDDVIVADSSSGLSFAQEAFACRGAGR